jgi:capsular exopolysaccharide synthesis family protein
MLPGVRKRVFSFHDVLMYVALARKHLRLMVLLMCFSWLAGLVYYVYARPVYYSKALIRVNEIKQASSAEKAFNEPSRLPGIIKELGAPHIIAGTAARLGVKASHQDVMKYYVKKVQPRRNSEDNIEVEVYPYSADWAKRWTEAMLAEYEEYRNKHRQEELAERIANHENQMGQLDNLLKDGHAHLVKVKSEQEFNKAQIVYESLRTVPEDLVLVRKRLNDIAQVRIELLDSDLNTVEKLSRIASVLAAQTIGTGPKPAPANENGPNQVNVQVITPSLNEIATSWHPLEKQLNDKEAEKAKLGLTYLEGNPQMMAVQKEIDAVKVQLDLELNRAMKRLELDYNEALQKQKDLTAKLPAYEKAQGAYLEAKQRVEMAAKMTAQFESLMMTVDKNNKSDLYNVDKDKMDLTYIGLLQTNDNPVSPNRLLLFLGTTALGLLMALGIPFLVEYLDHTLSNLEQVESAFQLRGLGIIPKVESADNAVALLDSPEAKEQNLLENFRVIRTNLLSMGALSKPPHVLMITSAMPKEGKTVVSTNLALSFAQTGGKTLLMDTDLRRGRLHRFFGYRKQPGLSGVLLGQCTIDEAIRPTPHENLFIVSAGQHLETGTELLGSPKFAELMVELRKRFDRIVLDTPPVLGLSETSVLQNQVDGVLFVIWSGFTPIKSVKAAVDMLQGNGANFYGFVLNRLDLNATANYYQYYYYSHDYYYQYSPRSLENA